MGENAPRLAEGHFAPQNNARLLLDVYTRVVESACHGYSGEESR